MMPNDDDVVVCYSEYDSISNTITFKCPICSHESIIHINTGKRVVVDRGDHRHRHVGSHADDSIADDLFNKN